MSDCYNSANAANSYNNTANVPNYPTPGRCPGCGKCLTCGDKSSGPYVPYWGQPNYGVLTTQGTQVSPQQFNPPASPFEVLVNSQDKEGNQTQA